MNYQPSPHSPQRRERLLNLASLRKGAGESDPAEAIVESITTEHRAEESAPDRSEAGQG